MIKASKFRLSGHESASPESHDHGIQEYLQSNLITPSECISKFTRLWCSRDRRQTPHHQRWATPRMTFERISLERVVLARGVWKEGECMSRDNRTWWTTQNGWLYQCFTTVHEDPHQFRGSTKAWQECMGLSAGNDSVCISYNEMMFIHPEVSHIYTACCWVSVITVSPYVYI